jgi:hypothetical protein
VVDKSLDQIQTPVHDEILEIPLWRCLGEFGCTDSIMGVLLCVISSYRRFDHEVRQAKGF